jgi:hypothetical protein
MAGDDDLFKVGPNDSSSRQSGTFGDWRVMIFAGHGFMRKAHRKFVCQLPAGWRHEIGHDRVGDFFVMVAGWLSGPWTAGWLHRLGDVLRTMS